MTKPHPHDEMVGYAGRGLLADHRALITGGDAGIGRAVAIAFAKEGADVAIAYLGGHADAERTAGLVRAEGRVCELIPGDLGDARACAEAVSRTVAALGGIDILVNNVAARSPVEKVDELTERQWLRTFEVNVHSYFRVTAAALPHLDEGSVIINTGSVSGLRGDRSLIDYSATKGAVHVWTYSMAQALLDKGIRVNCVAPGPVSPEEAEGSPAPYGRAAQPDEVAPSYVFLAAERMSSYITGEVIALPGGETAPR